jgi:hypothetical protein
MAVRLLQRVLIDGDLDNSGAAPFDKRPTETYQGVFERNYRDAG